MRKMTAFTICLALLGGCNPESRQAESISQDAADEWTVLFNGKDLTGWRSYGEESASSAWIVEDDALVLNVGDSTTAMTGGDLITVAQYENFELELEWKISEGGNSGIFFGVREIAEQNVAYETGIEMQILDDETARYLEIERPHVDKFVLDVLPPTVRIANLFAIQFFRSVAYFNG